MVGHVGDDDAFAAQQTPAQDARGLRVQQVEQPMFGDEAQHDDGQHFVGAKGRSQVVNVVQNFLAQRAIGRVDDLQARAITPLLPLLYSASQFAGWSTMSCRPARPVLSS